MKRGETKREREREIQKESRDELHVLSLLSDGVGVKRLIGLKRAGTSRYFPYNIRELDRDHC